MSGMLEILAIRIGLYTQAYILTISWPFCFFSSESFPVAFISMRTGEFSLFTKTLLRGKMQHGYVIILIQSGVGNHNMPPPTTLLSHMGYFHLKAIGYQQMQKDALSELLSD